MIAAADAVFLHPPIEEAGPAMHAAGIKQPGLACLVAEENEILAEKADPLGPRGGISREGAGLPVAAQQFAAPGATTDQRESRAG